jgi:hypothetical protein
MNQALIAIGASAITFGGLKMLKPKEENISNAKKETKSELVTDCVVFFFILIVFMAFSYWLNTEDSKQIIKDAVEFSPITAKTSDIERNILMQIKQDVNVGNAPF